MKPSDFKNFPSSSRLQKVEAEIVATNILVILGRTGDEWRELSEQEYETERKKDGNWSPAELDYFRKVRDFTVSPEAARLFSPYWKDDFDKYKQQ